MSASTRVFRLDINGLRALAVAAVLLFHFGVWPIEGGFAGVDVFFVISGYLMTQIITSGLDRGSFSTWGFWWARFSRIVPALAVLCAILLVFGWLCIEPMTLRAMASSVVTSLLFISNFQYLSQAGYFSSANGNWLLHTWSLSVEWQFYLLYPLFLVIFRRLLDKRFLAPALAVLIGLSFASCVVVTYLKPMAAFYLLPARAWELLAGGLVFLRGSSPRGGSRSVGMEMLGLSAVAASLLIFDRNSVWPSFRAGLPVLGTVLVMSADRGDRSVLALAPIQAIGRWSYSIYLWHWPLIVAFRYFGWLGSRWSILLVIGLAIPIGAASYRYVERPAEKFLRGVTLPRRRLLQLLAPSALIVCALAVLAVDGAVWRSAHFEAVADTIAARQSWAFPAAKCEGFLPGGGIRTCLIGNPGIAGTLVIGDSEAQEWYPRYAKIARDDPNFSVTFATRAGCPPVPGVERVEPSHKCSRFARAAMDLAASGGFEKVVLIASWSGYFGAQSATGTMAVCARSSWMCRPDSQESVLLESLTSTLERELTRLSRRGKQVYIVLPFPVPGYSLPEAIAKREFWANAQDSDDSLSLRVYDDGNDSVRAALSRIAEKTGATVVDPLPYMCGATSCPLTDESGRSLFIDASHLRPSAVQQRFAFLDPEIMNRIGQPL